MLKLFFVLATVLLALAYCTAEEESKPLVAVAHGHQREVHHKRHHITEVKEEHAKDGRVNVPLAPHHSKAQRHGRRHKLPKGSKASKSGSSTHHHNHQKSAGHHKKARKAHARKHH